MIANNLLSQHINEKRPMFIKDMKRVLIDVGLSERRYKDFLAIYIKQLCAGQHDNNRAEGLAYMATRILEIITGKVINYTLDKQNDYTTIKLSDPWEA